VNEIDPVFLLGDGSIVTTGHKIDFTDRVEIGRRVILGGRNSSLWTHNRQRTLQWSTWARRSGWRREVRYRRAQLLV
jgi:hypothetical protein